MGNDLGHLTAEQVQQAATQQGPSYDIRNHPEFRTLQERQNYLASRIEEADRQKFESATDEIVSEMEAVQLEKDSFGNYLYPELQNEQFLAATEQLVSALKGTIPDLTYGEALKRAWSQLTGKPLGNSQGSHQARLPQANQIQNRAVQAAVSVRGKTAPSGKGANDIPADALNGSATDTARYVIAQMRRGAI